MSENLAVYVRTKEGKTQVGVAVREGESLILRLGVLETGAPVAGAVAVAGAAPARPPPSGGAPTAFPNYGRGKNGPIAGASADDLSYYAAGCRRTLADANKARWHDKEKELLAVIEAEMARQGTAAPRPAFTDAPRDQPPPPSDDDIPF